MRASSDVRRTLTFVLLVAALAPLPAPAAIADGQQTGNAPIAGSWWQSGWKLCKPVAQLSAEEIDPSIENLEFRPDGTFAVTWQGGGAHTEGVPHVFIPDYTGRYTIDAAARRIRMQIVNGLFVPNDFSGTGTYAISGNALTLTGVWFGTRRATHKPDICELTFTKR